MKKRTFKALWVTVQTVLFLLPLIAFLWWTPYVIDHDEHMVETVNERAFAYESDNGTITDFTQAEIMDNDARLEYEERVWNLEHQELYWIKAIIFGSLLAMGFQLLNIVWYDIYNH